MIMPVEFCRGNVWGVHGPGNIKTDLSGKNALLSDHFYYFGSRPVQIPKELYSIIHTTQNCKLIRDADTVSRFEKWISQYDKNKIYADPQLKYLFDNNSSKGKPLTQILQ
jgi:hypothetical protein